MKLDVALLFCIVGAAVVAIPNMTRRGILFGYTVPPKFREGAIARKSVADFRMLVALALIALLLTLFLSPATFAGPLAIAGPVLLLLCGGAGFLRQRTRVAPFAVNPVRQLEADLTTGCPGSRGWQQVPSRSFPPPSPFSI
jgi:hypothetical protein